MLHLHMYVTMLCAYVHDLVTDQNLLHLVALKVLKNPLFVKNTLSRVTLAVH